MESKKNIFKFWQYLFSGVVIFIAIGFASCSNELDVTSDWKEQLVLFAVFNKDEPVHYIRVSKSYLDPTTSALVQAQISDSIYAKSLQVRIDEYDLNGRRTNRPSIIARDTILQTKEPGIFLHPELLVYSFTGFLSTEHKYRVVVKTPSGLEVYGETNIVGSAVLGLPLAPATNTPGIDYSNTAGVQVRFNMPTNATMANLGARIFYEEYPRGNPSQKVLKFIEYPILNNARLSITSTSNTILTRMRPNQYFSFLVNKLEVNPDIMRDFLGMEFNVVACTEDLAFHIVLGNNSSTLVQVRPEYSNVVNGLGIIASRTFTPYLPSIENHPDYPFAFGNPGWYRRARRDAAGLDSLCRNYPQYNFCN